MPDPRRPWTEEDKTVVWEMSRAGVRTGDIARRLGRDPHRVASMLHSWKHGKARPPEATEAGQPPDPVVLPPDPADLVALPPDPVDPVAQARLRVRPEADLRSDAQSTTGDGDDWTPAEDVVVLRGLTGGHGSEVVAGRLPGRSAGDVRARFRALVPAPGIDAQRRALAAATAAAALVAGDG